MKAASDTHPFQSREKGAVMVLVAVGMAAFVGFAALAVDLGYLYVTRNELQNIADGAALAATRRLGAIYQEMSYEAQQSYVCSDADAVLIRSAAESVAASNKAGGTTMDVRTEDVLIGQWDGAIFTETSGQPDAVRVIARRDDLLMGPVSTWFAGALGIGPKPVRADAIAALTGQSTAGPGELELPIGIARYFFENPASPPFCDEDIQFYPTNDPASCAGWTSWDYGSNDITLRRILQEDPSYLSPETVAGESVFGFTGGTLSNPTFDDLLEVFQEKGFDVDAGWNYLLDATGAPMHQAPEGVGDPLYETDHDGNVVLDGGGNPIRLTYPDGTPRNRHKWLTTVPVYDRGDCSNPNQSIKIIGFAEIELRDVLDAPDKLVRGLLKCGYVGPGPNRGGGGEYGLKGSIPGLVE